jgi:hypothetical protein
MANGQDSVQHHVHHIPPVQTVWGNVFDQDQISTGISPWRRFSDGKARSNWSVYPVGVNGTVTTLAGIVEGSFDGTNVFTIATISAAGSLVNVQNICADRFRVKLTTNTLGTAEATRVGVGASGT